MLFFRLSIFFCLSSPSLHDFLSSFLAKRNAYTRHDRRFFFIFVCWCPVVFRRKINVRQRTRQLLCFRYDSLTCNDITQRVHCDFFRCFVEMDDCVSLYIFPIVYVRRVRGKAVIAFCSEFGNTGDVGVEIKRKTVYAEMSWAFGIPKRKQKSLPNTFGMIAENLKNIRKEFRYEFGTIPCGNPRRTNENMFVGNKYLGSY